MFYAKKISRLCILIFLTLLCYKGFAKSFLYPQIPQLNSRDFLFKQYQEDVQQASKMLANERALGSSAELIVNFYTYKAQKGENAFTISARCSIPQETLATINHIDNANENLEGRLLILPTVVGLYIPLEAKSQIELILATEYSQKLNEYKVYYINGQKYYLVKNARFSNEARAFFLDDGMVLPLEKYILTSKYGMRVSPISGKEKFHRGIDMAASIGTPVLACKTGRIKNVVSMDYTYGNYIIIEHENGITSMYAHLSKTLVKTGDLVKKGDKIANVGDTGLTTGPHLHFEISLNGKSCDPQQYIK